MSDGLDAETSPRATASRRFPHLAIISGRAICLRRRVHKGLWHHSELTTRRAVLSQLHSSLFCGLRTPGHHWRGTSDRPLNNSRGRADTGKAQSQRRGSSTAQSSFVDTRDGWRCRRSQVSRGWNPAFIPQFIGNNRKGQYKLRCTPMQPHDGIPCTAPGHGKAECPSYPAQAKNLLVVTDSQSLLAAVTKGPRSQTDWTEDRLWQRLLTLTCAGWSVQLQFCYEHRGVHVNELADH
ncbi:putative RNase H [Trypanosoma cruzi]|uniref:Putative RNase H n=1 Tax=Trypanosoma cruzi TaxID=5693 RepID=A0A2V2WFX1_TRYCR|nr:putative RNase H [Trypanosoma cruzi]